MDRNQTGNKGRSALRNEKGLTLIELLAVIVILAIISAIAIPAVGGIINKSKGNADQSNALLIIDAARYAKIGGEPAHAADATGQDPYYTLETLESKQYLESAPVDPHSTSSPKATYNEASTKVYVHETTAADGTITTTYAIVLVNSAGGDALTNAAVAYAGRTTEESLLRK